MTVLHAELRLVDQVPANSLVMLGYPEVFASAEAVPAVLRASPIALEGFDGKLVSFERAKRVHTAALHLLPEGGAYLLVQLGGDDQDEADRNADRPDATATEAPTDDITSSQLPGQGRCRT